MRWDRGASIGPFALYKGRITALVQGAFELDTKLRQMPEMARIRCPHCKWQPEKTSRWYCLPAGHPEYFFEGCGHGWNTFDTRGRCPGCSYQWRNTSCLKCEQWAKHEDWYEQDRDGSSDKPE